MRKLEIEFGPQDIVFRMKEIKPGESKRAVKEILDAYEEWLRKRDPQFKRLGK